MEGKTQETAAAKAGMSVRSARKWQSGPCRRTLGKSAPGAPDPTPFEGVWCEVVSWLQEDPDASAVVLLGRLQEAEPDRFSRAHLRTLQRRVQQWRGIMAKKLVYATAGEPMAGPAAMPELALVGRDPRC